MVRFRIRFRRRGSTTAIAMLSLGAVLVMAGVEIDYGRLIVTRQKDQVIADASAMAAMLSLPRSTNAYAAGYRVQTVYKQSYNNNFTSAFTFSPTGAAVSTQVKVMVSESVPSLFPGIMSASTRTTSASATASVSIPGAFKSGVVPIGIQYNSTFDLTSSTLNSPNEWTLKSGNGSANTQAGNFGALDFSNGSNSGASQWSTFLKTGDTTRLAVGDQVISETGNMNGPTDQAIQTDTDSRLNRAALAPYTSDTYSSFHPGNPRIMILPLVDWTGISGTKAVTVKGFGAFWLDSSSGGKISGRFVRDTLSAVGWDNDIVDTSTLGQGTFDGGVTIAGLAQ